MIPRKSELRPIGSTITKSVSSADAAKVSMLTVHFRSGTEPRLSAEWTIGDQSEVEDELRDKLVTFRDLIGRVPPSGWGSGADERVGLMSRYEGSLKMEGEAGLGLDVVVDLEHERMLIRTRDSVIGEWSLKDVGVHSEHDGVHLRLEGEQVVLSTKDDAGFATEIGLRSASPRLRRMMGARRKS